jgi:hypothetical protein
LSDVLNNYDTAYSLLWGSELAGGRAPDLEVPLAPTPHPLQNLVSFVLALPGDADLGMAAWNVLALAALVALGLLTFALARRWFGVWAGLLAAVIVLTREPVLSFGLRAYVDLPYLCLLLGALLAEVRRPRAGTPVLVLLALAGLLRPEAWLFAGAYAAWLWHGGALRARHVALVLAAPLLWALHDLALTGDPLWSLTGTRDNAQELGRRTGLDDVPLTAPRRLGEILREPVLLGALGGTVLCVRRRLWLPLAALALALGAFVLLAAAGLPILTRYLLAPALLLAVLAAGAATDLRDSRPWQAFAVVVLVALVAFAPPQARRIDRLVTALDRQDAILAQLRTIVRDPATCGPVALVNQRGVPQVRLWTDLEVRTGADPRRGTLIAPPTLEQARRFVIAPNDAERPVLPRLPGARPDVAWAVERRCP